MALRVLDQSLRTADDASRDASEGLARLQSLASYLGTLQACIDCASLASSGDAAAATERFKNALAAGFSRFVDRHAPQWESDRLWILVFKCNDLPEYYKQLYTASNAPNACVTESFTHDLNRVYRVLKLGFHISKGPRDEAVSDTDAPSKSEAPVSSQV